jgi:hypothetical protein
MKKALPADDMPMDTHHTKKPATIISLLDGGTSPLKSGTTSLKTQVRNNARIIHKQNEYYFGITLFAKASSYRFDEITRSPGANMVWKNSRLFVEGPITAILAVVPKPTAVRLLFVGLMLLATVGHRGKGLSA